MRCRKSIRHQAEPKLIRVGSSTGSTPPASLGPPKLGKARLNRWTLAILVIGIIVVGGLFSLIYYTTAQVSTKTFSYSPPGQGNQQSYNSLSVTDVDGLVSLVPWSRTDLLINGTVTARGLGSSLSVVNISNSSNNGDIVFKASFPAGAGFFFSQSYAASINVYIPTTTRFAYVQVSNVNGGIRIHNLNSITVQLTTVNGAISIDCLFCSKVSVTSANGNISTMIDNPIEMGSYNLTATNANIAFLVPTSSSFKVTAIVANGSIQLSGFKGVILTSQTFFSHAFGAGGANVNLKSVNGQISITGT